MPPGLNEGRYIFRNEASLTYHVEQTVHLSLVEHQCRPEDHRLMARTAAVGSPLRHPAFQRLWLGLSLSYLGDQFTIIALLWFVLQLTGSGAAVGLAILCFDLPGVVTGAILGRLLDRYQPRLVMGYDNLARAALIAAIPTLYALGSLQLWHVFVLALLAGALSPATAAGVRAFVPHLVDDAALDRANALTANQPAIFVSRRPSGSRLRRRQAGCSLGAVHRRRQLLADGPASVT